MLHFRSAPAIQATPIPTMTDPLISIVIPTSCEATRAEFLHRSLASIASQAGVRTEILLVCNGPRQDAALIDTLTARYGVKTIRLDEGKVSRARYEGLCQAGGDYFCFLDDDDEFLPGGLARRLEIFARHTECDIVVTNGVLRSEAAEKHLVPPAAAARINADPAAAFFDQNWFASPASMFRAAHVSTEFFDIKFKYFEWTYLFFSLVAAKRQFVFDESLTYRKYEDHPMPVSKSIEYKLAYPDFLLSLQRLDLGATLRQLIRRKYVNALNTQAKVHRSQRQLLLAWKAHLRCLGSGGLQFLPFTRRLLFPFFG